MTLTLVAAGIAILIGLQCLALFFSSQRKAAREIKALETSLENRTRLSDQLLQDKLTNLQTTLVEKQSDTSLKLQDNFNTLKTAIEHSMHTHRENFDKRQMESLQTLQVSLQKGLEVSSNVIGQRVDKLTESTEKQLHHIRDDVEKSLSKGFEKTTEVFADVVKRLAIIDQAQEKITELSGNVVTLQDILNDKRSRGAFGEVQLNSLIRNVLPENHFSLQHTFSNNTRVDCLLYLPEPTGNVAIDAKFPLESYRTMTDTNTGSADKRIAEKQFKQDVKKHIDDIATKYIIPGETADGAVMFLPAEAVFSEIHAHHPDLVDLAHKRHVWIVSPTTMMAILSTARAVIKDEATQKQVHIIREHLGLLAKDFDRFETRMENLSKHINQAQKDVDQVHASSKKITSRFNKIESVDLEKIAAQEIL
jgi:DNA recombination protein RmuC